ncbi:MAG: SRPBCC family protein [Gammaproteobacteria bacterium]|nr:MAG: SRPBCC family protein [Gammaproteobacteria bacterium]
MQTFVEREVPITADKLWGILGDFGNMGWAPGIEKTEVIGEGIGMIRRIHMPNMPPIDEVLESVDHSAMHFSYTIPRGLPMPIKNYRAEVQLTALPNGSTRIHWACTGKPEGISDADVAAIMQGAYDQMIGWLVDALS